MTRLPHPSLLVVGCLWFIMSLGCTGPGCIELGSEPWDPLAGLQEPVISTDLEALRDHIDLPADSIRCAFRLTPFNYPGGSGPMDAQLVAWVELSSKADLDKLYGKYRRIHSSGKLSEAEAQVLPEAVRAALPRDSAGLYELGGILRIPKHPGGWRITRVMEVDDTGVVIWATID